VRRWDVFCRVVDNYGDAAVCWRLARQLAAEHQAAVRLWIDDPQTLARLQPEGDGVSVLAWNTDTDFGEPAEVAVDAFDAGLPEDYAARMPARSLWIKLEYLSAEDWVESHHGLPSPHPSLAVRRHFFFPGFSARTGGLLRERGLFARRDAFEPAQFWRGLGFEPPPDGAQVVSLFGYRNPAAGELLRAMADGGQPVVLAVTDCPLRPAVEAFGEQGNLHLRYLPFLPQARYDELLWACDWNFVRGEDSFVRAQWAARPFVWQIYPQAQDAHRGKLEAFLRLYGEAPAAVWRAWNGWESGLGGAWTALQSRQDMLRDHAGRWAARLGAQGELAGKLAQFAENLLK